jgi:transcriptional regulator with XRE-family HTH domain
MVDATVRIRLTPEMQERLRRLRQRGRKTQAECAELIHVTSQQFSYYETGCSRIDVAALRAVIEFCGGTLTGFFPGEEPADSMHRIPIASAPRRPTMKATALEHRIAALAVILREMDPQDFEEVIDTAETLHNSRKEDFRNMVVPKR